MKLYVSPHQSLKTQPGLIPTRDGPGLKVLPRGKKLTK